MLDLGKCLPFDKREFLQSQPKKDFAKTFSCAQVPAFREFCPSTRTLFVHKEAPLGVAL